MSMLRWCYFVLTACLVVLSLPVFAAIALALRLSAGPIDVTDSARRLLAYQSIEGLGFSRMKLAWNGWGEGPTAPIGVLGDRISYRGASLAHGFAAVDLVALLHGRLSILSLQGNQATFALVRDRNGSVRLDAAPAAARPSVVGRQAQAGGLDFNTLQQLDLDHAAWRLRDTGSSLACSGVLHDVSLAPLRRPAATAVTGQASASFSCGASPVLQLAAQGREGPQGEIVWHLRSSRFTPADYAQLLAPLAPLAALAVPVELAADATLSGGFGVAMLPRSVDLRATLGAGSIRLDSMPMGAAGPAATSADDSLPLREGLLQLKLSLPDQPGMPAELDVSQSHLTLAQGNSAPVLGIGGRFSRSASALHGEITLDLDRFDFATLPQIWPQAIARGARGWVTGNVTSGAGRDLQIRAVVDSATGPDGLKLTALSGGLDASNLTVSWLQPIEPLRGMDAHLVVEGPDALRIQSRQGREKVSVPGGQTGRITAGPTLMRITGLSQKDQFAQIDTRLHGDLRDILTLLANPRLRLLSKHPLDISDPSGAADIRLELHIPLLAKLDVDALGVRADATIAHAHLGGVVAGRDLDDAQLRLSVTTEGMKLQGTGALGSIPVALATTMDFRAGGPTQITQTAHVTARLDAGMVRHALFDPGGSFDGSAGLTVDYIEHRNDEAGIAARIDLADAGLQTPYWRKVRGAAGEITGKIELQNGRLVAIPSLHGNTPGLSLEAHADQASTHARSLVIDDFAFGRTKAAGRIDIPVASSRSPVRFELHGPALDLTPFLSAPAASDKAHPASGSVQPEAGDTGSRLAWRGMLAFGKVFVSKSRAFTGVTLRASAAGSHLEEANLSIDGPTPITASLSALADASAPKKLAFAAADSGAMLDVLGLGHRIQGGALTLDGSVADLPTGLRLAAIAELGPFELQNAPLMVRLARDLSGFGFSGGGDRRNLAVSRVAVPFVLEGDQLRIRDAAASSAALGATLHGLVDLRQETLDLRGTVVPSYLLNALPGRLPGLGRVFSPEKGGGLLAATLRITGPLDQPKLHVNPLAILAPGILRRLLFN